MPSSWPIRRNDVGTSWESRGRQWWANPTRAVKLRITGKFPLESGHPDQDHSDVAGVPVVSDQFKSSGFEQVGFADVGCEARWRFAGRFGEMFGRGVRAMSAPAADTANYHVFQDAIDVMSREAFIVAMLGSGTTWTTPATAEIGCATDFGAPPSEVAHALWVRSPAVLGAGGTGRFGGWHRRGGQ